MPNLKFEITNPEAVKLITDLKSGALFAPVKAKIIKYRWIFISLFVFIALMIALLIGKVISSKAPETLFIPQDLETPKPTQTTTKKSVYEPLRQEINEFNSDLPDPGIPQFDNSIDLETPTL